MERRIKFKVAAYFFLFAFVVAFFPSITFSAPLYSPGETLNPSCYPSNPDCAVATTSANYLFVNQSSPQTTIGAFSFPSLSVNAAATSSSMLYVQGTSSAALLNIVSSSSQQVFSISSTGSIGIGTTTPQQTFTLVENSSHDLFNIASSTGSSYLYVTSVGNVGIGTTTPGSQFTIQGLDTSSSTYAFSTLNASGTVLFKLSNSGMLTYGTTTTDFNSLASGLPSRSTLVGEWLFDSLNPLTETSGSTYNLNGTSAYLGSTINYGTTTGFNGQGAYTFNYAIGPEYIQAGTSTTAANLNIDGAKPMSLSIWLKPMVNPGVIDSMFFEILPPSGVVNGRALWLGLSGGVYKIGLWGNDVSSATTYDDNKWQHIVFTYANGVWKIYKNGIYSSSITLTKTLNAGYFPYFGPIDAHAFGGIIDNARLYSSTLTATDVSNLYHEGISTINSDNLSSITSRGNFTLNNMSIGTSTYATDTALTVVGALAVLETTTPSYFTGSLGIGTSTPATALSVIGTSTTQGLNISNLTSSLLAVDANGNVIATSTSGLLAGYMTNSYASSTFVSFPYASSTFASTSGLVANYVPYTGAIENVNLNNQSITNVSTLSVGSSTVPIGGVAYFNGNVGIGTTTPNSALTVIGTTTSVGNVNIATPSAALYLTDGNYTEFTRSSSGNIATLKNQIEVTTVDGTGGTITHANGYTIHTFTSDGIFAPPSGLSGVEVLVVAGGGGGGVLGGGGGAGGVLYDTTKSVVGTTSIDIGIGTGGIGGIGASQSAGSNGNNSFFGDMVAIGGGGGAQLGSSNGANGGSGGGSMGGTAGTSTQTISGGGTPYGNPGSYGSSASSDSGGGGGGGGGIGGTGTKAPDIGGIGGIGMQFSISGTATYYAGGGGGGAQSGTGGTGGTGGGGSGTGNSTAGGNAVANTGGGGGGSGYNGTFMNGGNGGSGIVIVSYPTPTSTSVSLQTLSLISSQDSSTTDETGINTFGMQNGATHLVGDALYFDIAGVNKAALSSSGLGIGTTTPSTALYVVGSTTISTLAQAGFVRSTTGGELYTDTSDYMIAGNDDALSYRYDSNGPLSYWSSVASPAVLKTTSYPSVANYGAWDGQNFWASTFGGIIKELNENGTVIATYSFPGTNPIQLAFDGTFIWIGSADANDTLIKLNPNTGTSTSYQLAPGGTGGAGGIQGVVWDGSQLWVGMAGLNTVAKINPSTGAIIASTTGQLNVNGLAYTYQENTAGTGTTEYIWAANGGYVSKINANTMAYVSYTSGLDTYRIATDGSYIYGASWGDDMVYKISAITGLIIASWPIPGSKLNTVAFDGRYIWTAGDDHNIYILDRNSGAIVDELVGAGQSDLVFDGSYMWSIEAADQTVRKISIGNQMGNLKIAQTLSVMDNNADTSIFLNGLGQSSFANGLSVGTSTPTSGNTLTVVGNVGFSSLTSCDDSSHALGTDVNGKVVCNTSLSDERLKNEITTLAGSSTLDLINALNPVSFYWKDNSIPGAGSQKEQFGFIAQQVLSIYPNLVGTSTATTSLTPDYTYYLNYQGFIALAISGIKELSAQVSQFGNMIVSDINDGFTHLTHIAIGTSNKPEGITLYSPNGSVFCVMVSDSGSLVSTTGNCTGIPSSIPSALNVSSGNSTGTSSSTSTASNISSGNSTGTSSSTSTNNVTASSTNVISSSTASTTTVSSGNSIGTSSSISTTNVIATSTSPIIDTTTATSTTFSSSTTASSTGQ